MSFLSFVADNRAALIFYGVLIAIIYLNRKRLDWQAPGVGMYRTKVGLKLMERWGKKYRGLVHMLGLIGIGVGFIGMLFIAGIIIHGTYTILTDLSAPPAVTPVIPGFNLLGHDFKVPLVIGWLALFVVIVIHEFSHGVVARAYDIPVKSSGLLVFGPLGGAFVEPDEKKMKKLDDTVTLSTFAAGPWSNVISAGIFYVILAFLLTPLLGAMADPAGVEVVTVAEGMPAQIAGLAPGMLITGINDKPTMTGDDLGGALDDLSPGDTITVMTEQGSFLLTTTAHPDGGDGAYLGITLRTKMRPIFTGEFFAGIHAIVKWLVEFFYWLVLLSLGLGLGNLLPLGPVDGGRMLQTAARRITGNEKRGDWWWKRITAVTLGMILIMLAIPIGRMLFF